MEATDIFEYLNINYKFSSSSGYNEEYQYVNEYHLEIFKVGEDERQVFIGKAKVELYLIGLALEHNFNPYYTFDSSQARRDFFNGIYDFGRNRFRKNVERMFDENFNSNLLVIDRIEILPQFRGHEYGKKIIKDIILRFNGSFGLAMLKAFPLQLEVRRDRDEWHEEMGYLKIEINPTKATRSLYRFYQSMGFNQMGKSEYFFLNPIFGNSFFDNVDDGDLLEE